MLTSLQYILRKTCLKYITRSDVIDRSSILFHSPTETLLRHRRFITDIIKLAGLAVPDAFACQVRAAVIETDFHMKEGFAAFAFP